jgi:predicted aspartyl protease
MTTVNYAMAYPYVANPPGYSGQPVARAWLEIAVHYAAGSYRFWAMVDTGADSLILDLGIAAQLGVPLGPPNHAVATAGGMVGMHLVPGLTVDLAGTRIQTDALFGLLPMPLLGRGPLLAAVEAGFGRQQWYHT